MITQQVSTQYACTYVDTYVLMSLLHSPCPTPFEIPVPLGGITLPWHGYQLWFARLSTYYGSTCQQGSGLASRAVSAKYLSDQIQAR